ncbi:hypothetical protein M6B38_116395 [Iris pallida]|uniref:Secreted protein n=1 Tax=Iris pallida TaxID=29817 RepID=A0AAX6I5B9_IRIPA|nr:hypothetical protein M6B38_366320 [Iris pallida]KAJ6848103.1 hypothetical protein M6B38_116395 [Iris pallida]
MLIFSSHVVCSILMVLFKNERWIGLKQFWAEEKNAANAETNKRNRASNAGLYTGGSIPTTAHMKKMVMCFLNLYRIHVYYSSFTKILCFMFTTHFVCILENRIGERA